MLPALYVGAIAHAPRGAWPYGLWGEYAPDAAEIARYSAAARTQDGFQAYIEERLQAGAPRQVAASVA